MAYPGGMVPRSLLGTHLQNRQPPDRGPNPRNSNIVWPPSTGSVGNSLSSRRHRPGEKLMLVVGAAFSFSLVCKWPDLRAVRNAVGSD